MKNWSKYQSKIFAFIEDASAGNAVVEAVAGSGKSTTIVEGMNRIPANKTAIFLAFNKAIAEELKARGVNARTFHSLTYNPVTKSRNARNIETAKLQLIVKEKLSGNDAFLYGGFITKMVGLGRQPGVGCLVADTQQAWLEICNHHDLELENGNAELGRALDLCSQLLSWSNAVSRIDFDDLLYLAVKDGLSLPNFDYVFVDEAQDTNAIQRALLRKILKADSRIIAVGDPAQAIYGFRGADSNSLNLIAEELAAFDLHTGKVLWQRWIDADVMSAPVAAGGELYATSFAGTVYRFDPASGDIKSARRARATSAPVVVDGQVYFSQRAEGRAEESLVAQDARSTRAYWSAERRAAPYLAREVQARWSMGSKGAQLDSANGFSGGAPASANASVASPT